MTPRPVPPAAIGRPFGRFPAKTVFLLQDLLFGGTQRQVLDLALHIDKTRFEVELWMMQEGDDLVPLAGERGIPMRWLSRGKFVGPDSLFRLWRRLRSERVQLLVLFTVVPNIWGRLLGKLAKVPAIVGTCRGGASPRRQHEQWLWNWADHHICNSQDLKKILTRRNPIPDWMVSVIPNGVDLAQFSPLPAGRTHGKQVVLSVARFVPDKDQETLVEAFASIADRHPGAELWLVGDGPLRDQVRRRARALLPENRVTFLPGRLDLLPLFQQSSLFVLSSLREGLPNVILEAMAAGLPVVATRVGGIPEVVDDGRTGLLVPARGAHAMASALDGLLADENLRNTFGKAGRMSVEEKHHCRRAVEAHEDLFDRLLDQRA
jgi:glycosyltransferase involved in cell wall biosynthesis